MRNKYHISIYYRLKRDNIIWGDYLIEDIIKETNIKLEATINRGNKTKILYKEAAKELAKRFIKYYIIIFSMYILSLVIVIIISNSSMEFSEEFREPNGTPEYLLITFVFSIIGFLIVVTFFGNYPYGKVPFSEQIDLDNRIDDLKYNLSQLEEANNLEQAGRYEDAAKICEKLKLFSEAGRVRKYALQLKSPIAQISGEKIHLGDESKTYSTRIDNHSVRIEDSIVQRSTIGGTKELLNNCPFCGRRFSFKKIPKFCPFCNEELE